MNELLWGTIQPIVECPPPRVITSPSWASSAPRWSCANIALDCRSIPLFQSILCCVVWFNLQLKSLVCATASPHWAYCRPVFCLPFSEEISVKMPKYSTFNPIPQCGIVQPATAVHSLCPGAASSRKQLLKLPVFVSWAKLSSKCKYFCFWLNSVMGKMPHTWSPCAELAIGSVWRQPKPNSIDKCSSISPISCPCEDVTSNLLAMWWLSMPVMHSETCQTMMQNHFLWFLSSVNILVNIICMTVCHICRLISLQLHIPLGE